tara:strand:- start:146 stop:295 length:150 start_codon:yes stop_codon:yes gene_type:complete
MNAEEQWNNLYENYTKWLTCNVKHSQEAAERGIACPKCGFVISKIQEEK